VVVEQDGAEGAGRHQEHGCSPQPGQPDAQLQADDGGQGHFNPERRVPWLFTDVIIGS
jgi:hypothetical protein